MIVVSTTFDPPFEARRRCLESVEAQSYPARHVYIDAAEQAIPLGHFENLLVATAGLDPDEVVVSLDGDDWLRPGALERVQAEHDRGARVTYGSFVFADGRPGFAAPVDHANLRSAPWTATHLKSYRAGDLAFIAREHPEHLHRADGAWLEHARDLAIMFALLELVGPERARFIPEILYVYNYANSTEFCGGAAMRAAERADVAHVRGLPPLKVRA